MPNLLINQNDSLTALDDDEQSPACNQIAVFQRRWLFRCFTKWWRDNTLRHICRTAGCAARSKSTDARRLFLSPSPALVYGAAVNHAAHSAYPNPAMPDTDADIAQFFATTLYRARLGGDDEQGFLDDLRMVCRAFEADDVAGQDWSTQAGYKGYTSYGSIDDLADESPVIAELCARLGPHLLGFAEAVDFDLRGLTPHIDSIWINILEHGGMHTGHIHANSVISGTVYVEVPDDASQIRFEDPRAVMMLAAPPRRDDAAAHNRAFVSVQPEAGDVLLWESWLRHDVPFNTSQDDRISISFNAVLV